MSRARVRITEEQRGLYKRAKKQGWIVTPTRNGHNRWVSPEGEIVFHPSTTSDRRSVLNLRSELRSRGLVV